MDLQKNNIEVLKLKLGMLKNIEDIYEKHPGLRFFENSLLFKFWILEKIDIYKKKKAESWSIISRKCWGDDQHWLITFHLGACGAQVMLRRIHIAYY